MSGADRQASGTPVSIRPECASDLEPIRSVNRAAFGREAEAELVDRLRACGEFFSALSLVASDETGRVVGHILLTRAVVETEAGRFAALALGPMAVEPMLQRRGVGGALIREAIRRAVAMGESLVIVLGRPEYYPRFGFERASQWGIRPPFEAPDEAWMALWIGGAAPCQLDGVVRYAEPFMTIKE